MLLRGIHYGFFISQLDADSVVALHVRLVLREIEVGEFRFIILRENWVLMDFIVRESKVEPTCPHGRRRVASRKCKTFLSLIWVVFHSMLG